MVARNGEQEITLEDKLLFIEHRKGLLVSLRKQKMMRPQKFNWMTNLLNSIEKDIIEQAKRSKDVTR